MKKSRVAVGLLGAGVVALGPLLATAGSASAVAPPGAPVVGTTPPLVKFADVVPAPPVIPGSQSLEEVSATHVFGKLVTPVAGKTDLAVPSFAYTPPGAGNDYLGPTIEATRGQPLNLTVTNNLSTPSPMAPYYDPTIPGDENPNAPVQTALHLHGGHTPPASDGGPTQTFGPGGSNVYHYPNDQQPTGLWYHDHALGLTRFNPMLGLAGNYLIRDNQDTGKPANPLGLPAGTDNSNRPYELPLVLQDRMFNVNPDGTVSLNYPVQQTLFHPKWAPESFGDTPVINGKAYPKEPVDQAVYRFRIVNGSQARFYNITLRDAKGGPANLPAWQIGAEGGLLNARVPILANQTPLLMGPGERADVLIDFSKAPAGATYQFANDAPTPYPTGPSSVKKGGVPIPVLMQFTVQAGKSGVGVTTTPTTLRGTADLPLIPAASVAPGAAGLGGLVGTNRRTVFLNEAHTSAGLPTAVYLNNLPFMEAVDAITGGGPTPSGIVTAKHNTVEEWDIVNTTVDAHPIHLHLALFQVLNRQNVNATKYLAAVNPLLPLATSTGAPCLPGGPACTQVAGTGVGSKALSSLNPDVTPYLSGQPSPPTANEGGFKDTVKAYPGTVTRILVPFGGTAATPSIPAAYVGDANGGTTFTTSGGEFYVWHCHILEHEENDMMQPYRIVP